MKSKTWRCKAEAQVNITAVDSIKARADFLRYLFDHPEKIEVQVDFVQDVEVPEPKEGKE